MGGRKRFQADNNFSQNLVEDYCYFTEREVCMGLDSGQNPEPDLETLSVTPPVNGTWRERFLHRWRNVPNAVRKTVVLVVGGTLLAIGGVLVILPGPFTLPFVVAALAVLASEFVWAERIFMRGQKITGQVVGRVRQVPVWIIVCVGLFVASGMAATAYWWFIHRV